MNPFLRLAFALLLNVGVLTAAAEDISAKVVSVKKYPNGRVVNWDRYVAIYDGYPVYDITLRLGEKAYIVRYESVTGYYPTAWTPGSTIQVKKERYRFVLMRGEERIPADIVTDHSCVENPTRNQTLPQLPC